MDFNDFVKKCNDKYFQRGVTAVLIETEGDNCHIMLCGKSIAKDETFGTPVVFADAHLKMPLVEDKVFEAVDDWFKKADAPVAVIGGQDGVKSGLSATVTKRCAKCLSSAIADDEEICADCQAKI